MKKIFFLALGAMTIFSACQDAPKADEAEVTDAQTVSQAEGTMYNADFAQSKVEWVGTKPTGKHHGTFKLKDGSLVVADNNLVGGSFIIDVKSLQPDDQDQEGNEKLKGHLLSADFFDAEKYPDAKFEITSVTPGVTVADSSNLVMKDATHTITGNLTLKDATKSITFPAKVAISDAQVSADANFNIDRTQWNMAYGADKSLGDKMIHSDVNLQVHLVATK